MKRREFIALACVATATWPLAARPQQNVKAFRVGMLETISSSLNTSNLNAFRLGLKEFGYIEGQNLIIEYRSSDGHDEQFPGFVNELLQMRVDTLVARGTPAVLAAKEATKTVPIVMSGITDPLLAVSSFSRPGGNITGMSTQVRDLQQKRVEIIKEMCPAAVRVAALFNMSNPTLPPLWKEIEIAARALNMEPQLLDIRTLADIEPAFETATKKHTDVLVVSIDSLAQANRDLIVELAARHHIPAIYAGKEFVDAGGLITYGVSYIDLYYRAAGLVAKIFKGAKPADLPVEQPKKFELVINLKAAKALGINVPPTLLARADEVIE